MNAVFQPEWPTTGMKRLIAVVLFGLLLAIAGPASATGEEGAPVTDELFEDRPRIGLVLSGGGARGAAHLGVLRVLEEYRVPVDFIVGTSGGAIIGGLYAAGWSPDEIERWLDEMDWEVALSDRLPRRQLSYRDKQDDERFLFDLELGIAEGRLSLPQALIEGRNLAFILEQATTRVADIEDFSRLPLPFTAMATDVEKAEKVAISSGRLAHAIRASMSVPGLFAPVELDDRLLVDGGLVDNLPVETALDLGADRIIAVNVGSRLQEREALDDIFSLSVQVSAMTTYKNTQRSIDLLEEADILIEPSLEELGVQDFHRSLEAAQRGEVAARELASRLQSLAVEEEDFQAFLERQRLEAGDFGEITDIRIRGLRRISERRIMAQLESRVGDELDPEQLQSDIGRLQRLGEIHAVDFRLSRQEEGVELELSITEKEEGPHHLRLGLEVFDEFDGSARYNLRLGHVRPSLNRLGGEWRSEAQIGHARGLRTEFYQPVTASGRYFLALPANHESNTLLAYEEGNRLAELSLRDTELAVDAGMRLGPHGELRLGRWWGRLTSDTRIGNEIIPELERDTGGWRLLLNYDRLDDAEWPREGQFLRASWRDSRESMGADQAYRSEEIQFSQFWPQGENRFLLAGEWGESNAPLPFQQQFEIGGPFSLSGYRRGELRGDRVAALRAVWYRRLGGAEVAGRGGALYAGAGLAAGAAWQHGEGTPSDAIRYGGKLFVGAGTPLGPIILGVSQSDEESRGFFLTLGLPIHRPRPDSATW